MRRIGQLSSYAKRVDLIYAASELDVVEGIAEINMNVIQIVIFFCNLLSLIYTVRELCHTLPSSC